MAYNSQELTTKTKILVLYASTYDMVSEKGEQLKGCSIQYLMWGEHGEALREQSEWNINEPVGYQRAKCSADFDLRTKMPIAPAIYEATFAMVTKGSGKNENVIRDIAYYSNVEMKEKIISGLTVPGMVQPAAAPTEVDKEPSGSKNNK